MPFIPHTLRDTAEMLEAIGVSSIQELFDEIPSNLKAAELKQIPAGMTEAELTRLMQKRSAEDGQQLCFIGAGAYAHPIPAAVWELVSRGEFMTAYTPYQAEASQGTLQLIYEYQTMMSSLMSMDVSNASLYDGASGLSEAILMAVRANKKNQNRLVAVVGSLSPD
ncbi:MAG: glycine dehydrogenase, partial [Gammaproteobacteria bacterium]|nr:glycine dehydrogenase [Gammaproteobacteria bacterium]